MPNPPPPSTELLRESAENLFASELLALAKQDKHQKPANWKLSPWAVAIYMLGGKLPDGTQITPKYLGDKRRIEVAVATLATSASYPTSYTYNSVWVSGSPITGGGRLHTETGPLGSTAAVTYSYDALGRTTGDSINSVGSSMSYDSLGRMTGATNPLGTFTYGYYGVTPRLETVSNSSTGLNTSYSYQTGSTQDYRLTDITNYLTGTTVLSKFDYTYNATGTIATKEEQADSSTPTLWTYGYDGADQLLSAVKTNTSTGAVISQYVYGYDLAGNRTSEQIGLGVTATTFNNLNQSTGSSAGGPLQFTGTLSKPSQVTVAGNVATWGNYYSTNFTGMANVTTGTNSVPIIAHDVNGNTATNNYQVVVPSGSSITPTYDSDGNLTNNGNGQTYAWDAENELTTVTYTGGATSNFTYDALGRRLSIIEKNSSGTVTSTKQFVWVGATMAEERDASNTVKKRFYAQGEQISGSSYYYTRDHLGSIREMTDSSGSIQARYDYDPYGRATPVGTITTASDFQYAGYYEHATSGLNLTLFRAYDPNTAKWLARDPLMNAETREGPNLYAYVHNDPILGLDPEGLLTLSFGVSWSGAYGYGNAGGSFGFIVDTSGNIGTYGTLGGGSGIGDFAGLFVTAQVTNAQCIKDTGGKGAAFAGEFGDVFDGSGEFNYGFDQNGNLYNGFALSAGVGEGAAYSQNMTTTTIHPLN